MAGGMRRGEGVPLRDRGRTAPPAGPPVPTVRHCWVEPPGHPGSWPGLVVEWRRGADDGWEGRCVYVVDGLDAEGARVVERWLPAGCLRRGAGG